MKIKFRLKREKSHLFRAIYRPIAKVQFWSKKNRHWLDVQMIVDTGADYTLLPRYYADDLKINLEKECKIFPTFGIGGQEKVYLYPLIKLIEVSYSNFSFYPQ